MGPQELNLKLYSQVCLENLQLLRARLSIVQHTPTLSAIK